MCTLLHLSAFRGTDEYVALTCADGYIPESTTSSSIDPLYSSEAQASTDAGGPGALERSERELLEEDDDLVDGGDSRSIGAEANATIGGDDVDDDDVDGDVDMEEHNTSTSTTASTSTGKPRGGPASAAAAGSQSATAAPSTSAASSESPATGTAQASGSASGSGSSSAPRKNEADAGAADDGVSSEGEHLNKSLVQSPVSSSELPVVGECVRCVGRRLTNDLCSYFFCFATDGRKQRG